MDGNPAVTDLRLLAVELARDPSDVRNRARAKMLVDAAEYLEFLETDVLLELDRLVERLRSYEDGSIKASGADTAGRG